MKHMITAIILLVLASKVDARTWTSSTGSKLEAKLIKVDGETVHLCRADNGKTVTISKDKLSDVDHGFLTHATLDFADIRSGVIDQIARLNRGTYKSRSDRATASECLRLYKGWIETYDKKPKDPIPEYKQLNLQILKLLQRKAITAYKYNEFLGAETEVPVQFNLFTDSDNFYFKVGDGDLSTIAPVSAKQLLDLMNAISKIQEWKQTCRTEKMNTRKEAGRFGGISLEFVSKEKGENIYVWMTAKGPWAKDRMIEEQTVRLTPLNISAMYYHIGKAKELFDTREQERKNAEKLK